MVTKDEALKLLLNEMEYVLRCIDNDIVPLDDDDFHEALRLGKEALVQPQEANNFCPRCGKRTPDLAAIHTCTPPRGLELT